MSDLNEEERQKLKEILATWDSAHRAIRVLDALGRVVKWLVGLGASAALIWSVLHGGNPK